MDYPNSSDKDSTSANALFAFPFPSHELAFQELAADRLFERIPFADRQPIVDAAWAKGVRAAQAIFEETKGNSNFIDICQQHGITVVHRDLDCVYGSQRYFSDFVSKQLVVTLYDRSCELWARQNQMSVSAAQNLILSHEFFHILEVTKLGLTADDYQVPTFKLGPLVLIRSGVQALSEIGAHGFAYTYFQLLSKKGISYE